MKIKLLFVPLSIVLSIVIIIWMIKPNWDSLKANKKELKKIQSDLDEIKNRKASFLKAKENYEVLGSDLNLINNAIPEKEKKDDAIAEIINKISATSLFLNEIAISEIMAVDENKGDQVDLAEGILNESEDEIADVSGYQGESELEYINIQLNLIGEYLEFKKLISSIYSMNRYLSIASLDIKKMLSQEEQEAGEDRGRLSMDLILKAYLEKGETEEQVSQLVASNNYVIKNLLTGKISENFIDDFKKYRTTEIYEFPYNAEGIGKENPFVAN